MVDLKQTAAELDAMVEAIPDLLQSTHVYLPVELPGQRGTKVGRASLGGILRRLAQLEASTEPELRRRAAERRDELNARIQRSHERWFAKLARELKSLVDGYQYFVRGVEAKLEQAFEDYGKEVLIRLEIARLLERAGHDPALEADRKRLHDLDARLRESFVPDTEAAAADGFATDPKTHWWLYGRPMLPEPS